jgi:intracellular septation protein
MSDRPPPNPVLRQALEWGPLLAFLATYVLMRDRTVQVAGTEYAGFVVAVLVFVPLQFAGTLMIRALTGKVSRLQVGTLVLVLILGAATVLFNDETFFKMRGTFVFGAFGLILMLGLWRGQSYLAWVLDGALPIDAQGWMILTRRMAWFFLAFAAMNEAVWRNVSTDAYVIWDTFGQMGVMFVFMMSNWRLIERHWTGPR